MSKIHHIIDYAIKVVLYTLWMHQVDALIFFPSPFGMWHNISSLNNYHNLFKWNFITENSKNLKILLLRIFKILKMFQYLFYIILIILHIFFIINFRLYMSCVHYITQFKYYKWYCRIWCCDFYYKYITIMKLYHQSFEKIKIILQLTIN